MENKKFYEYIEELYGEDIGDLFYNIEKGDIEGVKKIIEYYKDLFKEIENKDKKEDRARRDMELI